MHLKELVPLIERAYIDAQLTLYVDDSPTVPFQTGQIVRVVDKQALLLGRVETRGMPSPQHETILLPDEADVQESDGTLTINWDVANKGRHSASRGSSYRLVIVRT